MSLINIRLHQPSTRGIYHTIRQLNNAVSLLGVIRDDFSSPLLCSLTWDYYHVMTLGHPWKPKNNKIYLRSDFALLCDRKHIKWASRLSFHTSIFTLLFGCYTGFLQHFSGMHSRLLYSVYYTIYLYLNRNTNGSCLTRLAYHSLIFLEPTLFNAQFLII